MTCRQQFLRLATLLALLPLAATSTPACSCDPRSDDDDDDRDGGADGAAGDQQRGRVPGRNRPPAFLSEPPLDATEGEAYRYAPMLDDLDGDLLGFELDGLPAGMRLSPESGAIYWLPGQQAAGTYPLTLRATDEAGASAEQSWTLTVHAANAPPRIRTRPDPAARPGAEWVYDAVAEDEDGDTLSWEVEGPAGMAVDRDGHVRWTPSAGRHPVVLRVSDGAGGADVQTFEVATATGSGQPPSVSVTSPSAGQEVTGSIDVVGTIADDAVADWTIAACRTAADDSCREMAWGTGPRDHELLATIDGTLLEAGAWTLRVRARDADGLTGQAAVPVDVTVGAQAQVLRLEFLDMFVPTATLEVEVIRAYDGGEPGSGDWGRGWRFHTNYQAPEGVQPGVVLPATPVGQGWTVEGNVLGAAVVGDPRTFVFTLPDGRSYDAAFWPEVTGPTTGGYILHQVWDCPPGVTVVPRDQEGTYGDLVWMYGTDEVRRWDGLDVLGPFAPTSYELQTEFGERYTFDGNGALDRWVDERGVAHDWSGSPGLEEVVDVTRDGQGRITRLTDRETGDAVEYRYDAAGDMVGVRFVGGDFDGEEQTFVYDDEHRMISYDAPGATLPQVEYDELGRIVRVIDGTGAVTEWEYDGNARTMVAPSGARVTLEADEAGNVIATTDPAGNRTEMTYDAAGHELSRVDALGRRTTNEYDPVSGNVTAIHDPAGVTRQLGWNGEGALTSFTDSAGARYQVSQTDTHVEVRGPDGRVLESVDYDDAGHPTRRVDAAGNEETWTYDEAGRLIETRRPDGSVVTKSWENRGLISTTTSSESPEAVRTRTDVLGRVREVDVGDSHLEYAYDITGQPRSASIDGHQVLLARDHAGRYARTTVDDETTSQVRRDADGRIVSELDARGNVVRYDYDVAGRIVAKHTADGVEQYEYDAAGQLVAFTEPGGARREYAYDPGGRLLEVSGIEGSLRRIEYDDQGRPAAMLDEAGRPLSVTYDAYGRPAGIALPGRAATLFEYDETTLRPIGPSGPGRQVPSARIEPTGERWDFERDLREQRTTVVDPEGRRHTAEFDADGNLSRATLSDGRAWTLEREASGAITRFTRPSGRATRWDLGNGNVTETWDDGTVVVRQQVDATTTTSLPDGETLVARAGAGGVQHTESPAASLDYEYDATGRLLRATRDDGAVALYGYAPGGDDLATLEVRAPNGDRFVTRYTYDADHRLAGLVDPEGGQWTYVHDAVGRLTEVRRPNGSTSRYGYDLGARPTTIDHLGADGRTLEHWAFQYDAAERITRSEGPDGVHLYTYGPMGWLATDEHVGTSTVQFRYDAAGNIVGRTVDGRAETWSYDADDALVQAGEQSYGSDGRGNRTSGPVGAHEYDALNRLRAAGGTRFEYDALGNLVAQRGADDTDCLTVPVPIAGQVGSVHCVLEYSARGVNAYVFDALGVAARSGSDGTRHTLRGNLQSITALTDEAGAVTAQYQYDAWGRRQAVGDDEPAFRYGFTGQLTDAGTGYVWLRSRWYDPVTGRFLTEDAAEVDPEDPRSFNRYAYVAQGSPTNFVDPEGTFTMVEVLSVMNIQSTLRSIKQVAIQCARNLATKRLWTSIAKYFIRMALETAIEAALDGVLGWAGLPGAALAQGDRWQLAIAQLICGFLPGGGAAFPAFRHKGAQVRFEVAVDVCGAEVPGGRGASSSLCSEFVRLLLSGVGPGSPPTLGMNLDVVIGSVPFELKRRDADATGGVYLDRKQVTLGCRAGSNMGSHMLWMLTVGDWPPGGTEAEIAKQMGRCAACWRSNQFQGDSCTGQMRFGSALFILNYGQDRTGGRSRFRLAFPDPSTFNCATPGP